MKTSQKIAAILVILSQICLAFQTKNESVFCVKNNGNFAIESSVNGICDDSKTLPSHKQTIVFLI